jgi:hypothetical protein
LHNQRLLIPSRFDLNSSIAQPWGDPLIFIRLLVKNLGTFFHRFRCLLGR